MKNLKEIKAIGYSLIIAPICAVLYGTIYNIQFEKEAIIMTCIVALFFLFKQIYKLDNKK